MPTVHHQREVRLGWVNSILLWRGGGLHVDLGRVRVLLGHQLEPEAGSPVLGLQDDVAVFGDHHQGRGELEIKSFLVKFYKTVC